MGNDDFDWNWLVGLSIKAITGLKKHSEDVTFRFYDGTVVTMHHDQDCCEHVSVEDVTGDLNDLLGTPLLVFDERVSRDEEQADDGGYDDSNTWTFYTLRTIKGTVDIRWLGSSNGYYSEQVDVRLDKTGDVLAAKLAMLGVDYVR